MSDVLVTGTYIELNDIGESVICCNDIVSVSFVDNAMNAIVIDYKNIGAGTIEYDYKNIDFAMNDLKKIKETIKSFANVYIGK